MHCLFKQLLIDGVRWASPIWLAVNAFHPYIRKLALPTYIRVNFIETWVLDGPLLGVKNEKYVCVGALFYGGPEGACKGEGSGLPFAIARVFFLVKLRLHIRKLALPAYIRGNFIEA